MTRYGADALNGLLGRMVKVEFADGSVATGLLSATHPYYGTPREGKWMLELLSGGVYIFWQSNVKAVTVAKKDY